jgi:endonuclease/exonuclease/phosphatase family metal-dependent hydrolase
MEEKSMDTGKNSANLWYLSLVALTVLFGLQFLRLLVATLVYYLRDSLGYSSLSLAPIALGIFALAFLAGPLQRYAGLTPVLVVTTGGLALLRIGQQLVYSPAFNLYASAAGVALFLMALPLLVGVARAWGEEKVIWAGYGLLFGVALDTAVHVAGRTVDIAWLRGAVAALVIVVAAAVLLLALYELMRMLPDAPAGGRFSHTWPILAIGPYFFLQLVVFQNVARLAAITGWPLPLAAAWIVLGNALGLALAIFLWHRARQQSMVALGSGVIVLVSLFLFDGTGWLGALVSLLGLIATAVLLVRLLAGLATAEAVPGLAGLNISSGLGQLLLVVALFLHYVAYDIALGFRPESVLPVVGLLLIVPALLAGRRPHVHGRPAYTPAVMAAVLLLLPLGVWARWQTPQFSAPPAGNRELRVINYNLHNGFNIDGLLDMEAIAGIIEESNADVVLLQEVSRGWVINGSVDMLEWLSQRLAMPYVAGPTSGAIWGNAILSRYPLLNAANEALPPDHLLLSRGYVRAEVDVGDGRLLLINTHFHQIQADSHIRQEQVDHLLAGWSGAPQTVIAGDLNATPDAPEMLKMSAAGLVDTATLFSPDPPFTFPADDPQRRIDYIWVTPDLEISDFAVPHTTASDHLPIILRVTLSN